MHTGASGQSGFISDRVIFACGIGVAIALSFLAKWALAARMDSALASAIGAGFGMGLAIAARAINRRQSALSVAAQGIGAGMIVALVYWGLERMEL